MRSTESTIGTVAASPANAVMAVGGTLQVNVTGQTLAGTPITSFDSVVYVLQSVADTLRVRVSPTGLLTALAPTTNPVTLDVIPFKDGLAKGDQLILQVTATAIPGATLSIQPVPPDSTKLAQGTLKTIVPKILNASTGQSVANPKMRYTVRSVDIQKVGVYAAVFSTPSFTVNQLRQDLSDINAGMNGILPIARTGSSWIHADANVYGTLLSDSVQYTWTNPYTTSVNILGLQLSINPGFSAGNYLAPGGTVTFRNSMNVAFATSVTFTFDNPAAATAAVPPSTTGGASGNVTALTASQTSNRKFLTPGTYNWTATIAGSIPPFTGASVTGQIIVQ